MTSWSAALFSAALFLATGWLAGRWVISGTARLLRDSGFARPNCTGEMVPVGAGFGLVVSAAAGWALAAASTALGLGWGAPGTAGPDQAGLVGAMAAAVLGFGLLGLFDDLVGGSAGGGFRRHFRALLREGRLSTGAVKALGGGLVALVAASILRSDRQNLFSLLLDGALIALAANFVNLLDLRPGRAIKGFFLLTVIALLLAGWLCFRPEHFGLWPAYALVAIAPAIGAAAAALPGDLRAEFMLGDAGANALGASAGVLFALLNVEARLAALVILAALTVLSERFSFSRAIEKNRVLRAVDRWGRRGE